MSRKRTRKPSATDALVADRNERPRDPSRRGGISAAMGMAGIAIALICLAPFVLWGNPYPGSVVQYWIWGATMGGVLVVLVAVILPVSVSDVLDRAGAAIRRPSSRQFAAGAVALTIALSSLFGIWVFRRSPSTPDEISQLWHAQILLRGRLSLPVDPNPEFFGLETVVDIGRWYSQFPIGGPLVLLPGAMLGAPWLVNPVVAGLATLAMYQFARRAFGETQGRAIAALFALCPMVLLMAGTWMNHVPVLCLVACALLALVEWERAVARRRAIVCAAALGLALGFMATIRPLDAVAVASGIGIFQLWRIRREWMRLGELAIQGVFGAVGVAPLLVANAATTGSPFRFGYDVLWGAGHRVGFHADPQGNVHTIDRALEHVVTYVGELNMSLLAWPIPALLVAVIGLLVTRQATRWDALILGLLAAQVAAYAAYWGEGEFLGPRFLFTAIPSLIVLVARAPFAIADRFGPAGRRAATTLVVFCVIASWTTPTLSDSVWGWARATRGTRANLRMDLASAVRAANVHHAVVFLREPFGGRLLRRMWGVGVSRSEASQLLALADACSLLSAVQTAERNSLTPRSQQSAAIARLTTRFVPTPQVVRVPDPNIHITSPASLTPACRSEIAADQADAGALFGPALPLEPIDASGRLDGDVIYAADLGERNEVLRARFGDRSWYRLTAVPNADGSLRPVVKRY